MQSNTAAQISTIAAKPILKWAGGKTQMLGELLPKVPSSYGRYIEPFFGGGALFFALQPENAVIADSNPELINMYRQVADHVDNVISYLEKYQNTSEMFYSVRSLDWETLPKAEAAARTIYLNRTCYNGLYRVNKKGQFNVPYGKYKNPKICDTEALHAASQALRKADIVCGDYFLVLEHTQTKKFKSYPTPFSTRKGAADAFDRLFKKFANSVLIVSYSSNSLPTQDEMVAIMAKYKKHVEVVPVDYKYSFGNQSDAKTHRNSVQEYLFVGY